MAGDDLDKQSSARSQFAARMAYREDELLELEKRMAIPECWGPDADGNHHPMTYNRLLELIELYGEMNVHTIIYYAGGIYYGSEHGQHRDIDA